MKSIMAVRGIYAVGMHHHGCKSLPINEILRIDREPGNVYDTNACAVVKDGKILAYLQRHSAKIVAGIIDNCSVNKVFIKAKYEPEVKSRKGPQQHCYIGIVVNDQMKELLESYMQKNGIVYYYL